MSNILEQLRNKRAIEYDGINAPYPVAINTAYQQGWDAALALNLPVEFARWQNSQRDEVNGLLNLPYRSMSWNSLYTYWINNIYRP